MVECSIADRLCDNAPPYETSQIVVRAHWPIQVLLIEDDPDSAELVKACLVDDKTRLFAVDLACNLVQAVVRLSQPGIDVVLLDLGLPELTGYKSYRVIESVAGRKVPIVVFTSDECSISKDLTLGFGAAGYLLKQESSPAQLKNAIRQAVMSHRPE